jgi:pimeloyl-ACP methyl ester carboxylesterase
MTVVCLTARGSADCDGAMSHNEPLCRRVHESRSTPALGGSRSACADQSAPVREDVGMESQIQHVSIHGHDMAYRMEGSGPVLLLLHGIAGSSRTWRDVIPRLTDRFTVLAPDLTGHGQSEKPVGDYSLGAFASGIRDLLEVLGIDRATVIGQSFGGGVAMQFVYQYPEQCERLVLVNSGGLGREVNWILRLMALPASEYVMPVLFPSFVRDWGDGLFRMINDRGIRLGRITEMWSAYASLAESDNRRAFARTIKSVIDPGGQTVSAMDRLYLSSSMPTLIIWGDRDDIIPVSHAYAAHQAIPGSRLVVIEGVGHFPQIEAPEQFVDALVDFIDTTEPAHLGAEDRQQMLRARSEMPQL